MSDTRLLMHAERRIEKHDCSAVREIADFAHDEDLAQAIIDRVLERGVNLGTMKED